MDLPKRQFMAQALFIGRLQQSRSKRSMNLKDRSDNVLARFNRFHLLVYRLALMPF